MEYVDLKMLEELVLQEFRLIVEMLLMVVFILLVFNEMVVKCRFVGEIVVGFYYYIFNIVLSCFEIIEGKIWYWDVIYYYFFVLIIVLCQVCWYFFIDLLYGNDDMIMEKLMFCFLLYLEVLFFL